MAHKTLKNLVRILTLTCDQAARLMSQAQDQPLERPERWALYLHLLICRWCRRYHRQLKLLRAVLTRITEPRADDAAVPPLLDPEQNRALQDRLTKKIRDNLDSM
jgi:hypothetical protein